MITENRQKIDVVLISPPIISDLTYKKSHYICSLRPLNVHPPLALSCLAEYLKKYVPSLATEILDGEILSLGEIKIRLAVSKPLYVGISPTFFSYETALEIARFSKNWSAKVILGGHYAAGAVREILLNRGPASKDYCVDAICQQDGERCLADFVLGRPFKKINNLIYQEGREIKFNPVKLLDLNRLPKQDFSFLNIPKYFRLQDKWRAYSISYLPYTIQISTGAITVFSRKGCAWRSRGGACYFCSLMYREERYKSPLRFFRELDFLVRKYKPEFIFDVSDDFLDNEKWLSEFHRLYRKYPSKPKLQIHGCVSELNHPTIKKLAELNTKWILLGVESGDDRISSEMKKGSSVGDIKRVVQNLAECGINAGVNLIIGNKGETLASLKNTIKLAETLKKHQPETSFLVHFLKIIPGTLAHRLFIQKTGSKYKNRDFFDQDEAFSDWLCHFTKVSYNQALSAIKRINDID